MTAEVPDFPCSPGSIVQDNITFQLQGNSAPKEIIRLDSEGFHYRGQLIEDAGEAHRLFIEFMRQANEMSRINHPTTMQAMSNPYRAYLAELLSKIDYTWGYIPADVRDLMDRARILLTQTEPPELTDEELLEIRDGAYCPVVGEVNDEDDSMWQYTSDYIDWLYDQGTFEEQQQYEAKGLRAVFNAGRRTRGHQ